MVKTKKSYVPDRMDIVWIDFSPTRGHEQANVRPALVLSSKAYNQKTHLAVMCPITSHIKGHAFEVAIREAKVEGVILADHIRSLAFENRKMKFVQKASPEVFDTVRDMLSALLFD